MAGFAGRRVWIIGASAGMGETLARAMAAEGAALILSARDAGALERLAADCGGAEVLPLDLAQPETLAQAVEHLRGGPPLDALICTAAVYDPAPVAQIDPQKAALMVQVNILGTLEVARICPPLIRDGGQLVLFGSVAGWTGLPGGQPYSATKAAVNNLTETLAAELHPRVDVRLVCPGFVRSRLTEKNDFRMPAIISAEEAAAHVLRGLRGRRFLIHFPKRFTLAVGLLRILPRGLALRLTRRL